MGKYEEYGLAADEEIAALAKVAEVQDETIDRLNTQIVQLNKALADCQGQQPGASTIFGASLQAGLGSFQTFADRCGGLEMERLYLVPGKMPLTLKDAGASDSIDKRMIVLSWKGSDADINKACDFVIAGKMDSSLRGVMSSKSPKQKLRIIFRHEPDEEAWGDGKKFRDAQTHIRVVVNDVNSSGRLVHGADWEDVKFDVNFMSWSLRVSRNIEPLWVPGIWDAMTWDGYSTKSPLSDFNTMWGQCIAYNASHGNIPIAINEYGAIADAGRNQWLKDLSAGFKQNKFVYASYWNSGVYVLNATEEKTLGALG